jgi:hypothetical protein
VRVFGLAGDDVVTLSEVNWALPVATLAAGGHAPDDDPCSSAARGGALEAIGRGREVVGAARDGAVSSPRAARSPALTTCHRGGRRAGVVRRPRSSRRVGAHACGRRCAGTPARRCERVGRRAAGSAESRSGRRAAVSACAPAARPERACTSGDRGFRNQVRERASGLRRPRGLLAGVAEARHDRFPASSEVRFRLVRWRRPPVAMASACRS